MAPIGGLARSPPSSGLRSKGGSSDPGKQHLPLGSTFCVDKALKSANIGDKCGKCRSAVKGNQDGILCEVCEVWYHSECGGLKRKEYEYFGSKGAPLWVCAACEGVVKGAGDKIKRLENENEDLRRDNREIMGKVNELFESMSKMKEDIMKEIRGEIMGIVNDNNNNEWPSVQPKMTSEGDQGEIIRDIRREVMVGVKEEEDKRKRECNTVIHGMKKLREKMTRKSLRKLLRINLV